MYKLVTVVVDSDAYERTFEFRAIVRQASENKYEDAEARNVLLDVLSLNNIFEVKLRGSTQRTDMVELNRLVQTDDKFVDGLYVSFRNCNKNIYYFTDLLRNDIAITLDWRDCESTDVDNVVSEVLTVFGKLQIVETGLESGYLRYTTVLNSQQFKELVLKDFPPAVTLKCAKKCAEILLVQAMAVLLFDDSYSNHIGFTFETEPSIEERNRCVLNTCVGRVFIENVVPYPASRSRIYSCDLLFPWSGGDYAILHNILADRLTVEVDLLIKKKIKSLLNTI